MAGNEKGHLMESFQITAHNGKRYLRYAALATSSVDAALAAADLFGDEPCSVTVTPLQATE